MVVQKQSARQVVDLCHKLGRKVVAGGPLVTASPHEFDHIDHLVLNEAEITFPQFLSDLSRSNARHAYTSSERPDLATTPLPRWDLVSIRDYLSVTIQFSRGCPYDCEFCDIVQLYGRGTRVKTLEQVNQELDAVYATGWRGRLFVVDDNFIGAKAQARAMLRTVIEWQQARGHPFDLYGQASIDLAEDEDLLNLMSTAGFELVVIGFESPQEASLKETGKYQNCNQDMIQVIKTIHSHGMEVAGSFIVGFDSDPPDIFERQSDFIQNTGVMVINMALLNAFPKTRLYERLKKEGRLIGEPSGDPSDGSINFVPKMDPNMLGQGLEQVLQYIYSPEPYYHRMLQFVSDFKPVRRLRFDLMFVLTFIASIVYAGILDTAGGKRFFWKVLIRALLLNPGSLTKVLINSLLGYHVRRLLQGTKTGSSCP
jgi:radical SAM superfamily enzyme YgiQ (UPF0313 family)